MSPSALSQIIAAVLSFILYNDKDAGVGVAPSVPVAEEAEPSKKLVEQFDLVADLEAIKAAGYKLYTPIIVTNSEDYVSIKPTGEKTVAHGDKLLTIA